MSDRTSAPTSTAGTAPWPATLLVRFITPSVGGQDGHTAVRDHLLITQRCGDGLDLRLHMKKMRRQWEGSRPARSDKDERRAPPVHHAVHPSINNFSYRN